MTIATAAFRPFLEKAANGCALSAQEAETAFGCIMEGQVSEVELAAFLAALRVRGETVEEIAGAAAALRARMVRVQAPENAIDIVGTGGDSRATLNISTAAAFVLAGAGVPVAKHGNRAVSSKSGAADVLESLGVNVGCGPAISQRCLDGTGLAFLFAPDHHPAMRHAAAVRRELKLRTIFNILGPLSNPAGTQRQVIGVYSKALLKPVAEAMRQLGAHHVWVVHGADGLDELSTTGTTCVCALQGGALSEFEVAPEEAGLAQASLGDLLGSGPAENAEALRALLHGKPGPYRDIVLLNAAAGLIIAGRAADLKEGALIAAEAIDSGAAASVLQNLIAASHAAPAAVPAMQPAEARAGA